VVFDLKKLDWLNGVYIRQLSMSELQNRCQPFLPSDFPLTKLNQILPLVSERLVKLSDLEELTSFFYRPLTLDRDLLVKKADQSLVTEQITEAIKLVQALQSFEVATLELMIRELQTKHDWKKSQFFMMLRVAVTGKIATPPLFETMQVIGQTEVLSRLTHALKLIS
jgi:glutamyl/glutaminyl-tRNA synthetase